ncbi:MAG: alpha/beta fold hydrolase, partial [Pseudomonadota bacterium]
DRNGVRLYYEVHGDGPAVLLTHGFSSTSAMWQGQAKDLGRRCMIVSWDMRGHGQSDSPDDPALYSEAETVADMAAILDAVGASRAVIGGLSLGGYMSLAFNLVFPHRVKALMIFDSGPGYKKDEPREAWNRYAEKFARGLEDRGLEGLADGSPERVPGHHRSAKGLILAARGMLTQQDARVINSLPGITVPTLILVGEKDEPFLVPSDYMAAKIPGSTKVIIPQAGHAANIDQPQAFNKAVEDFLNSLPW